MGFSVEHILIQTDQLGVVREEEKEVLQRLSQEETLHLIPGRGVGGVTDVTYGGVAPTGDLRQERRKNIYCVTQSNISLIF